MPLSSKLFTKEGPGKKRLADCAVLNQSNFYVGKPNLPGTEDAVGRIQFALRSLGFTISDPAGVYGNSTAKAVFAFKSAHRPKPILGPGQTVPDNIVGIQTIAALDKAMLGKPPGPTPPNPPGPTPPNPKPPGPKPPGPKPPGPKPPDPPPPDPTPTRVWTFGLVLKVDSGGVFIYRLELTDPASNERVNFFTSKPPVKFENTLGADVNSNHNGTLVFSKGVTLDDIRGCLAGVLLQPLDRAFLNGTLFVQGAKQINSTAQVSGLRLTEPKDPAGRVLVISQLLE